MLYTLSSSDLVYAAHPFESNYFSLIHLVCSQTIRTLTRLNKIHGNKVNHVKENPVNMIFL